MRRLKGMSTAVVVAAALGWPGLAPAREPLRVSVSVAWGPPFLLPSSGGDAPRRGLIPDWYAALERELGRPLLLQHAPPARTKRRALEGKVDLRCFHHPDWEVAEAPDLFVEVQQVGIVVEERLVGRFDAPLVNGLAELRGRRVGTVLGYAYPPLTDAFARGEVRREDAPAEINALEKQREGRTDYAIVRSSMLAWLQREDPRWQVLRASPWVVSSLPMYCGVRRGGPLDPADLAAAQQRMVDSGALAAILARYAYE